MMDNNKTLLARAQRVIPGGVNSPVRAFAAVEGNPPFIARGDGNFMVDEDGRRFIDLVGSWGPLIFGHSDPDVVAALADAATKGTSFGSPTQAEVVFAEELCEAHPALQMVRLCSSGTEATMHALRLARGFTGRDKIVKLDGCYHGAHDSVLVAAGSGVVTFAKPGSPGIPEAVAGLTLTAPFGDADAVESHLASEDVAAVILEAVPGNMGCIRPPTGYLDRLKKITENTGTMLIIDEVMTGFRLALGGACERYDVTPDLVTLGKIVGGGLPLAAFGGRRDIMEHLSPAGPVYQAGTLSGNPLAVAAGLTVLRKLRPEIYVRLEELGARLERELAGSIDAAGASMTRVGSMFTIFFKSSPPVHFEEVKQCDFNAFGRFHRLALDNGVYMPPSQYEAAFLPASLRDIEMTQIVSGIAAALRAH